MLEQTIIDFEYHINRKCTRRTQSLDKQAKELQQIDQIFDLRLLIIVQKQVSNRIILAKLCYLRSKIMRSN
jgi:hypothetical protein